MLKKVIAEPTRHLQQLKVRFWLYVAYMWSCHKFAWCAIAPKIRVTSMYIYIVQQLNERIQNSYFVHWSALYSIFRIFSTENTDIPTICNYVFASRYRIIPCIVNWICYSNWMSQSTFLDFRYLVSIVSVLLLLLSLLLL